MSEGLAGVTGVTIPVGVTVMTEVTLFMHADCCQESVVWRYLIAGITPEQGQTTDNRQMFSETKTWITTMRFFTVYPINQDDSC